MEAIRDRRLEEQEPHQIRGLTPEIPRGNTCVLCRKRVPHEQFGEGGRYCLKCEGGHEKRILAHQERVHREMPKYEITVVPRDPKVIHYKTKLRKLRRKT